MQHDKFPSFYLKVILSLSHHFLIYYSIPTIIKYLEEKFDGRTWAKEVPERKIPNLGGIALFFAISVSASIYAYQLFDLYKFYSFISYFVIHQGDG